MGALLWIWIFQLHHTGIKTASKYRNIELGINFNCTIQELKLGKWRRWTSESLNFNCTIQELKHVFGWNYWTSVLIFQLHHTGIKTAKHVKSFLRARFQLHHTGIKTTNCRCGIRIVCEFQLHHTGIKTYYKEYTKKGWTLFQLHHTGIKTVRQQVPLGLPFDFNCTIQELKCIHYTTSKNWQLVSGLFGLFFNVSST